MPTKYFDATTREGKLLYAALCVLRSDGPENVKGQDVEVIIGELEKAVTALEHFKM